MNTVSIPMTNPEAPAVRREEEEWGKWPDLGCETASSPRNLSAFIISGTSIDTR